MLFKFLAARIPRPDSRSVDFTPFTFHATGKISAFENLRAAAPNRNGFTLIELLVATAILAVGILGALNLFPQNYDTVGTGGRLSIMNHLAQKKLDALKALNYNDTNLLDGTHPPTVPERVTYMGSSGDNVYESYTIRWEVRDDDPQENMKTVIVEVGHQLFDSSNNLIPASQAMHQEVLHVQAYISK